MVVLKSSSKIATRRSTRIASLRTGSDFPLRAVHEVRRSCSPLITFQPTPTRRTSRANASSTSREAPPRRSNRLAGIGVDEVVVAPGPYQAQPLPAEVEEEVLARTESSPRAFTSPSRIDSSPIDYGSARFGSPGLHLGFSSVVSSPINNIASSRLASPVGTGLLSIRLSSPEVGMNPEATSPVRSTTASVRGSSPPGWNSPIPEWYSPVYDTPFVDFFSPTLSQNHPIPFHLSRAQELTPEPASYFNLVSLDLAHVLLCHADTFRDLVALILASSIFYRAFVRHPTLPLRSVAMRTLGDGFDNAMAVLRYQQCFSVNPPSYAIAQTSCANIVFKQSDIKYLKANEIFFEDVARRFENYVNYRFPRPSDSAGANPLNPELPDPATVVNPAPAINPTPAALIPRRPKSSFIAGDKLAVGWFYEMWALDFHFGHEGAISFCTRPELSNQIVVDLNVLAMAVTDSWRSPQFIRPPRWANALIGPKFAVSLFGLCSMESTNTISRALFWTYQSLVFQKLQGHLLVNYTHHVEMPAVATDRCRLPTFLKTLLYRRFCVHYKLEQLKDLFVMYSLGLWEEEEEKKEEKQKEGGETSAAGAAAGAAGE